MAEENILIHHGGMVNNDFVQILKLKLPEIFEITSFISSPYYSFDNLITTLKDKEKHFTVLSLNCQSLNAKLDALVVFIEELRLHHFELVLFVSKRLGFLKIQIYPFSSFIIIHVYHKVNIALIMVV